MKSSNEACRSGLDKSETILFVHPNMEYGGSERQLLNLVAGISRRSRARVLVALYGYSGPLLRELTELKKVKVYNLEKHSSGHISTLFNLISIIRNNRVNIIYGFLVGPNLFGLVAGKLAGVKTIVWGNRVSSFTPRDFGLKGIVAALLLKYTSRLVDVIVSNSVVGQLEHEKRSISGKRNSVIWNGIDTKKYCPDIDERNRFRENLGIGPTTKLIGQVSRIVKWKGHQIALDAAAELRAAYPEVRFVFVGDGEDSYLSMLKEKTRQLDLEDKVYWLGERPDTNTIMNGLDIIFLPSLRGEGFANVIAEAMSTETVPVASDVGDSKVVVGDTGIVVEPGDVSELVNAWLRLISDHQLLVKMGSEARARVRAKYSLETMIESTCSVINNHDEHQIWLYCCA